MGGSKSKTVSPTDLIVDIPDFIDSYPPPRPPPTKKDEIFSNEDKEEPDEVARIANVEDFESLDQLVAHLTETFDRDVQKVRVLFMWLAYQRPKDRHYPPHTDPDTPLGYLRRLTLGYINHATMFTILCRLARIPCVIIHGLAKSASYEVGDQNLDNLRNSWNAVYVSGGWRIVFPLWAMSAVVGKSTGNWTLVEKKGQGVREKQQEEEGVTVTTINDYYFLTNPGEFIYRCFPEIEKWQLVKQKLTKAQFIKVPYFRPPFFKNGLQMASKTDGIIRTENGMCTFSIKSLIDIEPITLSYELFFNHKESEQMIPAEIQLDQYVAVLNEGVKTTFNLRFPVKGIYKLSMLDEDHDWVCFFKVICDKERLRCEPYPLVHSELGFGPCKETREMGLEARTHKQAVIGIRGRQQVDIEFDIPKTVDVRAYLKNNKISSEYLNDFIEKRVHSGILTLTVGVPKNGEYALVMEGRNKEEHGGYRNVCNYLITSEDPRKKQREYENATEKKTRNQLMQAMQSKSVHLLQDALDKFNELDLEDKDGEVELALERLSYLKLGKALQEGIQRRNVELLERALEDARNSKHAAALSFWIETAENNLSELRRLKRYTHAILEMKQSTVSEIHRYQQPKQCIFDIMKATFLLLGETNDIVEYWDELQILMRRSGKSSVLARVRRFSMSNVEPKVAKKALNLIEPYDKDEIAKASAGAGTFFSWIHSVAAEIIQEREAQKITSPTSPPTISGYKEQMPRIDESVVVNGHAHHDEDVPYHHHKGPPISDGRASVMSYMSRVVKEDQISVHQFEKQGKASPMPSIVIQNIDDYDEPKKKKSKKRKEK